MRDILRKDGKVNLGGWKEYIEENGWKTIPELKTARRGERTYLEKMFIENAIQERINEISLEIVKNFIADGLTISESLSLLETTKGKLLHSKVNNLEECIAKDAKSEEKQGVEDLENPEKMVKELACHMERIGDKYAKIIQEKMDNNVNHYGNGLAEINEGIRILHHIAGMIAKTRVKA